METSEQTSAPDAPKWLRYLSEALGAGLCLATVTLFALQQQTESGAQAAGDFRPPVLAACRLEGGGWLRGSLYGELEGTVDWSDTALNCDGMLRPEGAGLRLLFEASPPADGPLFVLGIPGSLDDALGREVATNLTIVEPGGGRFFNSGEQERCWTRIGQVDVSQTSAQTIYRVSGRFYCAGALPAVNGRGTVTPGEFEFAGRLTVERP